MVDRPGTFFTRRPYTRSVAVSRGKAPADLIILDKESSEEAGEVCGKCKEMAEKISSLENLLQVEKENVAYLTADVDRADELYQALEEELQEAEEKKKVLQHALANAQQELEALKAAAKK
ncbi:hypothetical protein ABZP36_009757 [Zizania latifolia]